MDLWFLIIRCLICMPVNLRSWNNFLSERDCTWRSLRSTNRVYPKLRAYRRQLLLVKWWKEVAPVYRFDGNYFHDGDAWLPPRSLLYGVLHVWDITLLPFHIVPDKSPFIVKAQDYPKGFYGNNVTNLLEFKLILNILDPLSVSCG